MIIIFDKISEETIKKAALQSELIKIEFKLNFNVLVQNRVKRNSLDQIGFNLFKNKNDGLFSLKNCDEGQNVFFFLSFFDFLKTKNI